MAVWPRSRAALAVVALAALLAGASALDNYIEDTERFPGWRGELPAASITYEDSSSGSAEELWRGRMELVSWEPRAFLFHHFLSDAECDHLMELGNGTMRKSTVADSRTGRSVDSTVRTSTGTFLGRGHDEVVDRIERRIALVSAIPVEHGEGVQLLRYVNGQKYEPHTDYFHDAVNKNADHGGQRLATMLMYLTTPDEGGETVFPHAATPEGRADDPTWSECARSGNAVKATRGSALLFFGLHPDGTEDPLSTHGSCPTLKGVKWSATKWMHVDEFNSARWQGKRSGKGSPCQDDFTDCPEWAVAGECQKNAGFMLERCTKSCGRCPRAKAGAAGRRGGASS